MSLVEEARTVRQRIATRLRELEPLVEEYNELRGLAAEMGVDTAQMPEARAPDLPPEPVAARAEAPPPAARPARPRRAIPSSRGRAQPASSDGDEGVAELILEAVRTDPGKTVAGYAETLGISPTALYRPVRELTNSGALVKRARALFPG
jgi:hypothetical protein